MTEMNIKFKPYQRRDGFVMLYANNDRGVSVGISEKGLPSFYGKNVTAGQQNLLKNLKAAIETLTTIDIKPDYESHDEVKSRLGDFGDLFITDSGKVCGQTVSSDGAYLARNGKIYKI